MGRRFPSGRCTTADRRHATSRRPLPCSAASSRSSSRRLTEADVDEGVAFGADVRLVAAPRPRALLIGPPATTAARASNEHRVGQATGKAPWSPAHEDGGCQRTRGQPATHVSGIMPAAAAATQGRRQPRPPPGASPPQLRIPQEQIIQLLPNHLPPLLLHHRQRHGARQAHASAHASSSFPGVGLGITPHLPPPSCPSPSSGWQPTGTQAALLSASTSPCAAPARPHARPTCTATGRLPPRRGTRTALSSAITMLVVAAAASWRARCSWGWAGRCWRPMMKAREPSASAASSSATSMNRSSLPASCGRQRRTHGTRGRQRSDGGCMGACADDKWSSGGGRAPAVW